MRTLFVSIMVYPPKGGTHLRNWQNINIMGKFGEVGVFSIFDEDLQVPTEPAIKIWRHFNIVEESSPSDLVERGIRLLRRFGLRYFWAYSNRAARALERVLKDFDPDVVVLEELAAYPYLEVVKTRRCKIIFDNPNVEAHLFQQINCSQPTVQGWLRSKLHLPQIRLAESNLARQADQIWLCSEDDQQLMRRLYGSGFSSRVIPNAIDVHAYSKVFSGDYPFPEGIDDGTLNVLFLGNFFYPPNQESAALLIEQAYPKLKRKFPDFRLLLVGSNPSALMQEARHKEADIIVTGEVPDVRPYLSVASLMVVPLQKGGGTRFKILEAFAAGCPVISTAKGAEGLKVEDGKHLLMAEDVDTMVEQIAQIRADKQAGERLVGSAYELVRSEYSWEAVVSRIGAALEALM